MTGSWYVAAGTTSPTRQVTCIVAALGAAVLVGASELLWLLAGTRSVRDRKAAVCAGLSAALLAAEPHDLAIEQPHALVAVAGGQLFHDSGCPAVAGKPVKAASRSSHSRANRRGCAMCQP